MPGEQANPSGVGQPAELADLKAMQSENKWLRVRLSNLEGRMTRIEKANLERERQGIYTNKTHR
jgi:hypothetical protein